MSRHASPASSMSGLRGNLASLTRSEVMSRIRGKGNKTTELRMVALLRLLGTSGWRRNSNMTGKPDFVFPRLKIAIFVDGCFWHGCPLHYKEPQSNTDFWSAKIATNKARDRKVDRRLRERGWRIVRVWEHGLRLKETPQLLARLQQALRPATRPRKAHRCTPPATPTTALQQTIPTRHYVFRE